LGCDGFDVTKGFYTPNIEEAHLNHIMIENAKEIIVVADSSKFGRKSLNLVGTVKSIHIVITDSGISNEHKRKLEKAGIKVMIAK
jgi:DeoR family transcriptional regulator of aga operon